MNDRQRPAAVATYARVSSADQKSDLETQSLKLKEYAEVNYPDTEKIHISDLAAGLNYRKKGLSQLLRLVWSRQMNALALNHKDRLLRFGEGLVFKLWAYCNVDVVIVEGQNEEIGFEQELAQDGSELMTVFWARLYGRRSHKHRRINRLK